MNYYIVIPAHNEESFLKHTLESIACQTLLPKRVVVVNDNSTDATETIIDTFAQQHAYITKLNVTSTKEHMPGSKVVNAFNKGLAVLDDEYGFLVKLDADLILPDTYFETIARIFNQQPHVGIAGGFAYEQTNNGTWKLNHPMGNDHVRGAFKAYTKDCYKAIGGLRCAMGWDTVDELLARYHDFEIYTATSLKVKHLRPTGASYNKKARMLQGKAMYTMRYGFLITAIASGKMAWKQKKVQIFTDNLKGYFNAKKEKAPFLVTQKEGAFIRNYRMENIKRKFL
ncbi:glycosyltransferase family A protein [Galbibacter sp. PAP.153]|uniref:glycosyltransferase family 2 protein n=1 Tax=Galbibacter sp. PAP.153 TaxID=3104623 RepID=UPI00300B3B2C